MKLPPVSYDDMLKESYCYKKQDHSSYEWSLVRHLYYNNYINTTAITPKIPKIIHQIWLGGKLPDKFKKYCDTWQKFHPDWEYRLWTDSDISGMEMKKRNLFDTVSNLGQKSDVLRYEILRKHGGIYVDTDFECIKPFDDLRYLDFFCGFAYDKEMVLYNGMIACVPENKILVACTQSPQLAYTGKDGQKIMQNTGAYYLTKCMLSSVRERTRGVVIFPPPFFYPFPNNMRHTNMANSYVKEYSYANHHWKTSWLFP